MPYLLLYHLPRSYRGSATPTRCFDYIKKQTRASRWGYAQMIGLQGFPAPKV